MKLKKVRISGIIGIIIWTVGILSNFNNTIGKTNPFLSVFAYMLGASICYFCAVLIAYPYRRHKSKPKIENICLIREIPKCKEWKIDTLYVTTSSHCTTCSVYNGRIFSLYGWNKKYPKFPTFLYQRKCPVCGKCIGVGIAFPDINTTQ